MSRDIFVQDIPADATSTADLSEDWDPAPLPFRHADVVDAVRAIAPSADFSDPGWGVVDLPGASIEVNVGDDNPLMSFALHVRASDVTAADDFIAELLRRLGARGFDSDSPSGIFNRA